jgi:hypothetical protein
MMMVIDSWVWWWHYWTHASCQWILETLNWWNQDRHWWDGSNILPQECPHSCDILCLQHQYMYFRFFRYSRLFSSTCSSMWIKSSVCSNKWNDDHLRLDITFFFCATNFQIHRYGIYGTPGYDVQISSLKVQKKTMKKGKESATCMEKGRKITGTGYLCSWVKYWSGYNEVRTDGSVRTNKYHTSDSSDFFAKITIIGHFFS